MMINDIRKMAEDYLATPPRDDIEHILTPEQRRLEVLCEPLDVGTPVYVLYPGDDGVAYLRRQELPSGQSWRAPWIKPGGPNSAYLVPVFKVDRQSGGKESKRRTTLDYFKRLGDSDDPAASFFAKAFQVLCFKKFFRLGQDICLIDISDAYSAAIAEIVSDAKQNTSTPLLIVALDPEGEIWPGDDSRLVQWLLDSAQRLTIYGEPETASHLGASCALCASSAPLYSNALAGAGLNFVNGNFPGSFPEMREGNAWRRFAICAACADLLYVYKNHVAPKFVDQVVGGNALIIPSSDAENAKSFGGFLDDVGKMMERADRAEGERTILRRLSENTTVATLSILWAENFGQKIDGIRGFVTHVLPTRLAELDKDVNASFNQRRHPFYPCDLRLGVRRKIDLNLKLADELLRRPGGLRVKSENQSPRRRGLLYELAGCVFHGMRIKPRPLWREIDRTAQAYLTSLFGQENAGVLYQCRQEAPKQIKADKWLPLSLNGWVRHLYLFLDYLSDERVNVLPKETVVYQATQEALRPLLSQARGLDTDAKRFTFLLGVLYGHLFYVQAKKADVNVAANALSWMRGGRLRAAELPELCGKITSKLLEYDALEVGGYRKWEMIHVLEAELGHLGIQVGSLIDPHDLPDEQVLYFLMLGIALSYDFTKSEKPKP